jgi:hypothetical protein
MGIRILEWWGFPEVRCRELVLLYEREIFAAERDVVVLVFLVDKVVGRRNVHEVEDHLSRSEERRARLVLFSKVALEH